MTVAEDMLPTVAALERLTTFNIVDLNGISTMRPLTQVVQQRSAATRSLTSAETWFASEEWDALIWLIVAVVSAAAGHAIMMPTRHRVQMLYCSIATTILGAGKFNRLASPLQWLFFLLIVCPPFLLAGATWTIAYEHWRVAALGCPIGVALLAASWGVLRFRADRYIWSCVVLFAFGCAIFAIGTFFILFVLVVDPFSFLGTSITMLCSSAVPSIAVAFAQLPWRSTSAVIAVLSGEDEKSSRLAMLGKKHRLAFTIVCLSSSVFMLAAYGLVILFRHPEPSVRYVGFVVAAGVVILDIMVWHLWRLGLVAGALQTASLMVMARVAACIWGANYWLVGHSFVVVAAGAVLAHVSVDCWLPRPNSPQLRRQAAAEEMLTLLEAKVTAAAAVAPDTAADGSSSAVVPQQPHDGAVATKSLRGIKPRVSLRTHPGWIFLALVVFFGVEVGLTWIPVASNTLRLHDVSVCDTCAARPQNYYGVLAIVFILIYGATVLVVRKGEWLAHNGEPLLYMAWKLLLPIVVCWLGYAAFVSWVVDTWSVLVNVGFLPVLLGLFYQVYRKWVLDDFRLLTANKTSSVAPEPAAALPADSSHSSGCCALRLWRLTPWVVKMWAADLLLLVAYQATMHAVQANHSRWIGWAISVALLVLAVSWLSNRAWFGTFKFGPWQWVAMPFVFCCLLVWAICTWQWQGEGRIDHFALGLLLVVFLYPAVYASLLALQMLRDAGWAPKDSFTRRFTVCVLVSSCCLYLAFLGVLIALGFIGEAICGLCILIMIGVFGAAMWKWRKGDGFLPTKLRKVVAGIYTLSLLATAVAFFLLKKSLFGGFSVICGGVTVVLACKAVLQHAELQSMPPLQQLRVGSDWFFPAFGMHTDGQLVNQAQTEAALVLAVLHMVALWGLVAAAVLQDAPYIGTATAVLALTLAFLYLCHLISEGGSQRTELCMLPPASIEASLREALAAEGHSGCEKVDGSDEKASDSAAGDSGPQTQALQEDLKQKLKMMLTTLFDAPAEAQQKYEVALRDANRGRLHVLPLVSLWYSLNALVAKCRGGKGCVSDPTPKPTSPDSLHSLQLALLDEQEGTIEATKQQQRLLARLQLCMLAAESHRRWEKESEFHSFLSSLGGTLTQTMSSDDFKQLPKNQRESLEQAWVQWRAAEKERLRLEEEKRKEEEDARRRRLEAERMKRKQALGVLKDAVESQDIDNIRAALKQATLAGLSDDDPDIVNASCFLEEMTETLQVLQQALAGSSITQLEQALSRAQASGVKSNLVERASQKLRELRADEEAQRQQLMQKIAQAKQELDQALGHGSISRLEEAIGGAEAVGITDLNDAKDCLEKLRSSRHRLQQVLTSKDEGSLQNAISEARTLGLVADELDQAISALAALVSHRQQQQQLDDESDEKRNRARRKLKSAITSGDVSQLEEALAEAKEADLPDSDTEECRVWLKRLQGILRSLEGLLETRILAMLEQKLAAARSSGLQHELVDRAEALVKELRAEAADEERRREEERRKREEEERLRRLEDERRRQREREEEERRRLALLAAQQADDVRVQAIDIEGLLRQIPAGGKFTDPDFVPEMALTSKRIEFSRLSDMKKDGKLEVDGMIADDVGQGSLGDCWFLSAMACCAGHPKGLQHVFIHTDVQRGVYVLRIYHSGVFRDIAVDDLVPASYGRPSFAKSRTSENEFWVPIMEKAYAKVYGSYDAIEGGQVSDGLVDLTGGIGDAVRLGDAKTRQAINDGTLWNRIMNLNSGGHLLGCGSHSGSDSDISSQGIVQGHAYSILNVTEVDGHRLMQLRNPWGDTEWKGKWSDKDTASWTQRMRAKLKYSDSDDGIFWMAFEDFVAHYSNLYICRVLGDGWCNTSVRSAWKGSTAGGCSNYDTFENNPLFRLKVKGRVLLTMVLEQRAARGTDGELFCIAMTLHRCRRGARESRSFATSGTYTNRRAVCLEQHVEPGDEGAHYVVATTFDPGEETDFSIRAYWRGNQADVTLSNDK